MPHRIPPRAAREPALRKRRECRVGRRTSSQRIEILLRLPCHPPLRAPTKPLVRETRALGNPSLPFVVASRYAELTILLLLGRGAGLGPHALFYFPRGAEPVFGRVSVWVEEAQVFQSQGNVLWSHCYGFFAQVHVEFEVESAFGSF